MPFNRIPRSGLVPIVAGSDVSGGGGIVPRKDSAMSGTSPIEFLREIRQELTKVTWPTRKETAVTTGMVFVMVFLLALFFLGVDQLVSMAVQAILGLGS